MDCKSTNKYYVSRKLFMDIVQQKNFTVNNRKAIFNKAKLQKEVPGKPGYFGPSLCILFLFLQIHAQLTGSNRMSGLRTRVWLWSYFRHFGDPFCVSMLSKSSTDTMFIFEYRFWELRLDFSEWFFVTKSNGQSDIILRMVNYRWTLNGHTGMNLALTIQDQLNLRKLCYSEFNVQLWLSQRFSLDEIVSITQHLRLG